jgi:hypothetical protein
MAQQHGAAGGIHFDGALPDGRGIVRRGRMSMRCGSRNAAWPVRAGGREGGGKQQVLPVGWQQIQQLADFGGKAKIQQRSASSSTSG